MCQQTQVATVIPYFQRFMKSFPTIAVLAASDEQELMKHWEGLGYYRRARSIHAAAKLIVDQHGGVFPLNFDDVLALPGIGRYTAGAILSISDGQRHPILEGNTQRVFSRLIGLRTSPTETPANKLLWEVSEALLPQKNVGVFNQAAMEIGALVCKPQQPQCDTCPLARQCAAKRDGLQAEIPGKMKRIKYLDKTEFAFVVGGPKAGYLMRPLPEGGRWAGLWDFPRTTEDSISQLDDAAEWISSQLGIRTVPGIRLKSIRHAVTKYRISLHVHEAKLKPKSSASGRIPKPWRYVAAEEFSDLPLSVTGRKIADSLLTNTQKTLPLTD